MKDHLSFQMKAKSLKMSTMNRRMNRDNIYSGKKLCDRAQ